MVIVSSGDEATSANEHWRGSAAPYQSHFNQAYPLVLSRAKMTGERKR